MPSALMSRCTCAFALPAHVLMRLRPCVHMRPTPSAPPSTPNASHEVDSVCMSPCALVEFDPPDANPLKEESMQSSPQFGSRKPAVSSSALAIARCRGSLAVIPWRLAVAPRQSLTSPKRSPHFVTPTPKLSSMLSDDAPILWVPASLFDARWRDGGRCDLC